MISPILIWFISGILCVADGRWGRANNGFMAVVGSMLCAWAGLYYIELIKLNAKTLRALLDQPRNGTVTRKTATDFNKPDFS